MGYLNRQSNLNSKGVYYTVVRGKSELTVLL